MRRVVQKTKRCLQFVVGGNQLRIVIQRSLFLFIIWICTIAYFCFNSGLRPVSSKNELYNDAIQHVQQVANYVDSITEISDTSSEHNDNYVDIKSDTVIRSQEEIVRYNQVLMPNVPFEFWWEQSQNKNKTGKKHKCAYFPNLFDLKYDNKYWQKMPSTNGTYYLYAAYYDIRPTIPKPSIRLLGMIDRIEPTLKTSCLLWYDITSEPIVMPIIEYKYIWNKKWGNYKQDILQPYLMTCYLPDNNTLISKGFKDNQVPISVSLIEKPCIEKITNNLRINNNLPAPKGKFAVCVKGLDFPDEDLSVRLIEWIELLGLLGAEKIFLYEFEVHPNVSKVLHYYTQTGLVDLTEITLPGDQPNLPGLRHMYLKTKTANKRQNELIPYNDCLYRNLYNYDYIVVIDTDEIILPKNVKTWNELMDIVEPEWQDINNPKVGASYHFRNVYFWEDEQDHKSYEATIPRYMHMLQHVYRSYNYTPPTHYVKCFHNVNKVLTLHNHFPFACLPGKCKSYPVNPEIAHMQHYRADCVSSLKKKCQTEYKQYVVNDTTIWRYKDELIPRVTQVLKILGFYYSKE